MSTVRPGVSPNASRSGFGTTIRPTASMVARMGKRYQPNPNARTGSWCQMAARSVLVVAPEPGPGLVAPMRRPVEPRVQAPDRVQPPGVGRVGVVDVAVLDREGAHAR